MKLGVITDGISRDLGHALEVMDEFDLEYAELQFIGDKEVGDLDHGEQKIALELIRRHQKKISCISRHLFAGMLMADSQIGDEAHRKHMEALQRCIAMAQAFSCPNIRIMTGKKEAILWGSHGAEKWNTARNAWEAQLPLLAPAVDLARKEGVRLLVETGNGTMVNSCWTARKLIDDLNARDVLKVLWDPANNCWAHEQAYPDGYQLVKDGYLGHIHIKDVKVDTPKATLEIRPMMQGQLAGYFHPIAAALHRDNYDGVISYESVYHPGDGDYEAGFRQNIEIFKHIFA